MMLVPPMIWLNAKNAQDGLSLPQFAFSLRSLLYFSFILSLAIPNSTIGCFGIVMQYVSYRCRRSFPICWSHLGAKGGAAAFSAQVRPLYFVAARAWECAAAHSHALAATVVNTGWLMRRTQDKVLCCVAPGN